MDSFLGKRGGDDFEDEFPAPAPKQARDGQSEFTRGASQAGDDGMDCEDAYADEEDMEEEVVDCLDEMDPEKGQVFEDDAIEMELEEERDDGPLQVWHPEDGLQEGEELDYDSQVYEMFHRLTMEWPCLSFDFVPDQVGAMRTVYPHELFFVAGTQADRPASNKIVICHASELHKTKNDDESADESDDEDVDDDAEVEWRELSAYGATNRIRVCPQRPNIVASWQETGRVHLWDIKQELNSLGYYGGAAAPASSSSHIGKSNSNAGKNKKGKKKGSNALQTFEGHSSEGYAMDWSPVGAGNLLTGDCDGNIYLWTVAGGKWKISSEPFKGHTHSVEDIQWSPQDDRMFVTCSVDRTIRLWDARNPNACVMGAVKAHNSDVNVVAWNRNQPSMIASGGDEGDFKIWDIRFLGESKHLISIGYHKHAITSLAWHPAQDSVLALTCADNQTTLWDFEITREDVASGSGSEDIPPQLLFVHQGQKDVKEVRWHPQIPGLMGTTALDYFNLFKTINSS